MKAALYQYLICTVLCSVCIAILLPSSVYAAATANEVATFLGDAQNTVFSRTSAGDVNGDGYGDFVVGGQGWNGNQGRVYVYFGGPSLTSKGAADADVIFTGEAPADIFGCRASPVADVNNDGYDDIIVGAFGYSGGANKGRVYIFYGGSSMSSKGAADADVILTGEADGDCFGESASSGGDVNKDGYPDVVVGALYYGTNKGRAYVFYGGPSLVSKGAGSADVILSEEVNNDRLGDAVSSGGDVNGDGYDDIIVGAYGYLNFSKQGRAYVFYGGSSMTNKSTAEADVTLTGEAGGRFGHALSPAIDVNNDGYGDVIVGGWGSDKVYIFYGGTSVPSESATDADVILTGEPDGNVFGYAVSSVGDVNNDGFADVIVGDKGYPEIPTSLEIGRAYIFYGGASLVSKGAASADVILDGENNKDRFGYPECVTAAGDVNGDGWNEWLIAAFSYLSESYIGKVYLYNLNYASPSISMDNAFYINTPSPTITGTASETGVNVSGVQISVNNGAWSACSASDGAFNSANEAFSCSLSGLAEGTYALRVRSYDENSVYVPSALYATADLIVDFTPPSDGMVTISAGGSYTNSQTVTLNISAFDALAGVSQMMLSEDPNFEGAEWQAYLETVEFTLSGESGTKVIYVRFMDRAGNVSGVYSYSVELLTETGADMSHTFTLGLLLVGVLVFTGFRKVYKKV